MPIEHRLARAPEGRRHHAQRLPAAGPSRASAVIGRVPPCANKVQMVGTTKIVSRVPSDMPPTISSAAAAGRRPPNPHHGPAPANRTQHHCAGGHQNGRIRHPSPPPRSIPGPARAAGLLTPSRDPGDQAHSVTGTDLRPVDDVERPARPLSASNAPTIDSGNRQHDDWRSTDKARTASTRKMNSSASANTPSASRSCGIARGAVEVGGVAGFQQPVAVARKIQRPAERVIRRQAGGDRHRAALAEMV